MLPSLLVSLSLAAAPEVALLGAHGAEAELSFQPIGSQVLSAPAVRFSVAQGSPVLGTLLPGTRTVVASAVLRDGGDLSFSGVLLRLEAGAPARVLADGLVYGSRPLVTAEGRVFVSRGRPGWQPAEDALRIDTLTIDEVDPRTGRARNVYTSQGYLAFLAGAWGREVLVSEFTPARTRLLAIHADTLGIRELLVGFEPMARDFVVDAVHKRLLFTQVGEGGWQVEAVSLQGGARQVLARGPEVTLLPTVLSDGRVLVSGGAGQGLRALDGGPGLPAAGPGFERLRLERGALQVLLHEVPSDFNALVVRQRGEVVPTAAPAEALLDVAGVTP